MTLGENIREARKKKGLRQEDLAKKTGLATITIRQYESGKRTPNIPTLRLIAHVLKTPTVDLLGDDHDRIHQAMGGLDIFSEDAETATLEDVKRLNLMNFYEMLNEDGQTVAVERVEELTEIPKYQKEPPQAAGEPPRTE